MPGLGGKGMPGLGGIGIPGRGGKGMPGRGGKGMPGRGGRPAFIEGVRGFAMVLSSSFLDIAANPEMFSSSAGSLGPI